MKNESFTRTENETVTTREPCCSCCEPPCDCDDGCDCPECCATDRATKGS